MTRVLVVDNYDSFVYTLNGYLRQLGRGDGRRPQRHRAGRGPRRRGSASTTACSCRPGPGKPSDAGVSIPIVHAAVEAGIPLLGVCLGHQAIAEAFGGVVTNAEELMHGKTSQVVHGGQHDLRRACRRRSPPPGTTRSRSWTAPCPVELEVTARTDGGVIMALQHRDAPVYGVQFHPESVMTEGGHRMLANWLAVVGDPDAVRRSEGLSPRIARPR